MLLEIEVKTILIVSPDSKQIFGSWVSKADALCLKLLLFFFFLFKTIT